MIYNNIPNKYLVDNSKFFCNVCYEEKKFIFDDELTFDGFYHPAGDTEHKVCCECMEQLICVCKNENCSCCGYNWKCPFCRQECALETPNQIIACMGKSWTAVDKIHERSLI